MKTKSFTIDRSKWLNGELYKRFKKVNPKPRDTPHGTLRDDQGRMCCLGFYSKACGVKVKDMKNVSMPYLLDKGAKDRLDSQIVQYPGSMASKLAMANDSVRRTPERREAFIKKEFAQIGVTVEFVGRYPAPKDIKPGDDE